MGSFLFFRVERLRLSAKRPRLESCVKLGRVLVKTEFTFGSSHIIIMISLHPKLNNYLWIARTRMGVTRKHLAGLIGHEATSQLSRWEDGAQVPTLANAFRLGYLLERPVEELFVTLREDVIRDIEARRTRADTDEKEEGGKAGVARTTSLVRGAIPMLGPAVRMKGAGVSSRRRHIYVR